MQRQPEDLQHCAAAGKSVSKQTREGRSGPPALHQAGPHWPMSQSRPTVAKDERGNLSASGPGSVRFGPGHSQSTPLPAAAQHLLPLQCPGTPDPSTGTQPSTALGHSAAAELEARVNASPDARANHMQPQTRGEPKVDVTWAISMAMSFMAVCPKPLVDRVRNVSRIYETRFGAPLAEARACLALCKCLAGQYDPEEKKRLQAHVEGCIVTKSMFNTAQEMHRYVVLHTRGICFPSMIFVKDAHIHVEALLHLILLH